MGGRAASGGTGQRLVGGGVVCSPFSPPAHVCLAACFNIIMKENWSLLPLTSAQLCLYLTLYRPKDSGQVLDTQ